MTTLKCHIKFISTQEEPKTTVRYRSNSYSAAFALKRHIELNEEFAKVAEIKLEACMSASAPAFQPQDDAEAPSVIHEAISAEELKQQ